MDENEDKRMENEKKRGRKGAGKLHDDVGRTNKFMSIVCACV